MGVKHLGAVLLIIGLMSVMGAPAHAAVLTVTNTNDSGAGSLRQAIVDAASGDEITFAVTGVITLTTGHLTIGKNLTITGPPAGSLTIDGNNSSRVFHVNSPAVTVNISGLTISNGNSATWGGCIENEGTLNIADCTIANCSANGSGNGYGGGIDNYSGTVTIDNCTISGNSATTEGGGVCTYGGSVTITESTISGNSSGNGGGISNSQNAGGVVQVIRSTIAGNDASVGSNRYGGGIFCSGGVLVLLNSTISGNSALNGGGGIVDGAPASMTITQCTITGNVSTNGGGGIDLASSTAGIKNSILAGNTGGSGNNFYSTGGSLNSLGYNLENGTEAGFTATGDLQNANPNLAALANNGGPTQTHALQAGSAAINAIPEGGTGYNGAPSTDQRGVGRPQNGNLDIGAFELAPQPPTVTTQAVSSLTTTTATGNGNITDLGSPNPTAHGVVWNTGGNPTTADSLANEGAASTTGAFTSNITGLSPGTTYYVRAYASNPAGTAYGAQVSFTTVFPAPTVTTNAASGVTATGATLNGTVNANGDSTTVTFEYGTTVAYGTTVTADQSPVTGSTDTAVSAALTGLASNTTYHFRVVGTNAGGTANGADMTFTTLAAAPTVTTQAVSSITETTATGNGNITDLGSPNPTAHGVVWNTGGNPTTADSLANEGVASTTGAFTSNITLLSPGTTYYVRAYASNPAGTTYGAQVSFTTSAPAPTATTNAASAVGPTGATLNGTVNANDDSTTVTFEYGTTAAYGTTVTADQSPISGTADTAVSVTIGGLLPGATYHYRVVGQNSFGTTYGADSTFAALILKAIPVLSAEGAAVLIGLLALVGALAVRRL